MLMRQIFLSKAQKVASIALLVLSQGAFAEDLFTTKNMTSVRLLSGKGEYRSRENRDITVFQISKKNPNAPSGAFTFYVQGGLHGDEKLTSTFVIWLADRFAKDKSRLNDLPASEIAIDFVPVANPDGSRANSRYNSRDVNLNRNFSTLWGLTKENPGFRSFSEPETQSIKYLLDTRKYTAAVDTHGYINWIVAPSMPTQVGNRDFSRAKLYSTWIERMGREMPVLGKYELRTAGELGDGGAFEDYAFWTANTFSFCIEMGSRSRYLENSSWTGYFSETDTFMRYEAFISKMFEHAIELTRTTNAVVTKIHH